MAHVAVHRRRGREMLPSLLVLVRAAVELAEAVSDSDRSTVTTFGRRAANSIVAQADVADKAESVHLESGLSPLLRETVGSVNVQT